MLQQLFKELFKLPKCYSSFSQMKNYYILFSRILNYFLPTLFKRFFFCFLFHVARFLSLSSIFFPSLLYALPLFSIVLIEEEAFGAATASAFIKDDGIEILQVYSREISRRMLDTVKNRAASLASSAVDASTPHTLSPSLEPTASSAWVCRSRPGLAVLDDLSLNHNWLFWMTFDFDFG